MASWTLNTDGTYTYNGSPVGDAATAIAANATVLHTMASTPDLPLTGGTMSGDINLGGKSLTNFWNLTGRTTLASTQTFSPILAYHSYTLNLTVAPSTAISISLTPTAGGSPVVVSGTTASGFGSFTLTDSQTHPTYAVTFYSQNNGFSIGALTIYNAVTVNYVGQVSSNISANGDITATGYINAGTGLYTNLNTLDDGTGNATIVGNLYTNNIWPNGGYGINLNCGGAFVATTNNLLDDGGGSMVIAGNITMYNNIMDGIDGNTPSINPSNRQLLAGDGTAVASWANQNGYGFSTMNNILDDGYGNMALGYGSQLGLGGGGLTFPDGSTQTTAYTTGGGGGTLTAPAFNITSSDIAYLTGGFAYDVAGNPTINVGLNASQFGSPNTSYNGALFRLDNRGSYPFFSVLYQPKGYNSGTYEKSPLSINNPQANTMPSVLIGWPTDGENTGYGTGENLQVYGTARAATLVAANITAGTLQVDTQVTGNTNSPYTNSLTHAPMPGSVITLSFPGATLAINCVGTVAANGTWTASGGGYSGYTMTVTGTGAAYSCTFSYGSIWSATLKFTYTYGGNLYASNISAAGYSNAIATKTSAYTLTTSDSTIFVNSASNITMTLPSAATAGAGREYTIKSIQSAATIKTSASGQKIDGTDYSSSGYGLSGNNKYITIVSDGSTNWYIVANN